MHFCMQADRKKKEQKSKARNTDSLSKSHAILPVPFNSAEMQHPRDLPGQSLKQLQDGCLYLCSPPTFF